MAVNFPNGTTLTLYIGGVQIAYGVSNGVSMSHSTRDVSNKSSLGYKEGREGQKSWEVSGEFIFSPDAAYGYEELFGLWSNRTMVSIRMSNNTSGSKIEQGDAYITSLEKTAGLEETVTFSASFEGTGPLTLVTLT